MFFSKKSIRTTMASLNLLTGLIFLFGIFCVYILFTSNGGRSMAIAAIFVIGLISLATLPLFLHGLFFLIHFNGFYKMNEALTLIVMAELLFIYFSTQGFHDIFYNNDHYEFSEFIVFLLMVSYLIAQFFIFPGVLKSSIGSVFKSK